MSEFADIRSAISSTACRVGLAVAPFTFTLAIDNPALDALPDGVHDLSLDVQGPTGRTSSRGRSICTWRAGGGQSAGADPRPRHPVWRLRHMDRGRVRVTSCTNAGRAATPSIRLSRPGDTRPAADIYQEEMAPHTDLFLAMQMWWEQPDGTKFTRALVPKWDEDIARGCA